MNREEFLNGVQRNVDRVRAYKLGGDGRNGECDCIGLIVGAIRLNGAVWNGTHGSNYAARNRIKDFGTLNANSVQRGTIVFKAHEPGDPKWALPSKYRSHPDQRDYYHVGVVTKTNPLEITHCTGVPGGIKKDSSMGNWRYGGELDYSEYGGRNEMASDWDDYKVIGGQLKMRSAPSKNASVADYLPDGTVVDAEPHSDPAWMKVQYKGQSGYCMTAYLQKVSEDGEPDGTDDRVKEAFLKVKSAVDELGEVLNL